MVTLSSSARTKNVELEYVTANDSTTSTSYSDATCGTIVIPNNTMGAIICRVNKATAGTGSLRLTDSATGTATYLELTTVTTGNSNLIGSFTNTTGSSITAKLQLKSSDANAFQIKRAVDERGAIMAAGFILLAPDTTLHTFPMKVYSTSMDFVGFNPADDDNKVLLNGVLQTQNGASEVETVNTIVTNNVLPYITYHSLTTANTIIGFDWTGINLNVAS